MKTHILVSIAALSILTGCASLQKKVEHHIDRPHPMDHRLGHILFHETPSVYPQLRRTKATSHNLPIERTTKPVKTATRVNRPAAKKATPAKRPRVAKARATSRPAVRRTKQLDITEVPAPRTTSSKPKVRANSVTTPEKLLATAQRLKGLQGDDYEGSGFLIHLLQENGVEFEAKSSEAFVKAFYQYLNSRGQVFGPNHTPSPGQLVFFHNTYDRDADERADDWFTLAGVVSRVDGDGTVHFISYARGQVRQMVMNLERPSIRRNESKNQTLNSFLRKKKLNDRPFTAYLAGELFASYATLEK